MSKIVILILGLSIIFLILLLIVTTRGGKFNNKNPVLFFNPSPTTSTKPELPSIPLSIVSVLPEDKSTNVPADTKVQIVFSRPLALNEVYTSFGPGIVFKTALDGNIITLNPQSSLVSGLTYKLLVKFNKTEQLSNQYQFTVAGTPPSTLPDTQPPGAAQQSEEFNRQNHPDIFLADKTPIKQASFDLYQGLLKQTPNEHYSFILVRKNDSAKNDLTSYLLSLRLKQDQIDSLDVIDISSNQFSKVISIKEKLPFYSENVSIGYDASFDKTTIYINSANQSAGNQKLNDFLKQNGVDSADWINNLAIIYQ